MKYISRKLYNEIISDRDARKAFALLIWVKKNKPCSVIPAYSHYKLSKLTGIHATTIKKYINILFNWGACEFVGKGNLRFNKVRVKYSNVKIDRIDYSSVKSIERSLCALLIVEVQKRKEYLSQLHKTATDPNRFTSIKKVKKAKKIVQWRGLKNFSDNGISYRYLTNKLGCSRSKASEAIKEGENLGLFTKTKNVTQIYMKNALSLPNYGDFTFARKNNIYIVGANTYSLL